MDLYEFEGKALLTRLGILTPRGSFCRDASEARTVADALGYPCVVKSQVLTGGRGKAGGIAFVEGPYQLPAEVQRILELPINGQLPAGVLVEQRLPAGRELYAAVAFDASRACPVLLFSPRGGVEVEAGAASLLRVPVGVDQLPAATPAWVTARVSAGLDAAERASLSPALLEAIGRLLANLLSAYCEHDLELLEINPLIAYGDGLTATDAKVTVDDDAFFRQPGLVLSERPPLGELETRARQASLQFVDLEGEIGLMANGAGLNLSLLDAVAAFGSSPANFLDTGGGASTAKAYEGLRILQDRGRRDPRVRAHLVMLSLAITRAREATQGIAQAVREHPDDPVPTFAVVHGTGADEGRRILEEVGIKVAPDIRTAVEWAATAERKA
ncbi:MAG: acetate--CoA ligase family protein [Thermoleophilia bacterium]|nr:acetate--CoA ligase family protein [Thermoleophilia bacterium]